ncbi:MAG: oligosaccharide MFS transporter [Candidatus Schmidhempelia sp.]|nr:oligosaccharide MFS transporter [Candidatus Schmidhempelia sp.]
MKTYKNANYWFLSSYLFTFFAAWSLWWSFYAIWLKSKLNLSGQDVGFIYAANSAAAMFFMIIYGILQDKLQTSKAVIIFQSIMMIIIGPFMIYIYEPLLQRHFILAVIIGAPILSAGFISGCPLIESFVERMSRLCNFEYGASRFWGSLGYAAATFIAGIIFSINPHINFWLSSTVGVIFLLINWLFKPSVITTASSTNPSSNISAVIPTFQEIFSLYKLAKFWLFVLFIVGTFSFYTIYDQQLFPNFYTGFFKNTELGYRVYGYLNSFQVFLESSCMIIAPYFIYKIGAKRILLIAACIMISRIGLSATVDNIYIISLLKLLHAIEIPLFVLAIFKYIVANFDPRLSATLYLVGFNISSNVGVIVLSTPVGKLFDKTNYSTTFYVLAGIILTVTIISAFTLSHKRNRQPVMTY